MSGFTETAGRGVTRLILLAALCGSAASAADPPQAAAPVRTVLVPNCRTSASRRAVLGSERAGLIERVDAQPGYMIERGQLVAAIRDEVQRAQLATLEREATNQVDLEFAQKLLELANLEYQKALQINEEFEGARSELDMANLRVAVERARLQVEQAAIRLELADLKRRELVAELKGYRVVAPFSGVVLKAHKEQGETVTIGEPLVELADYSTIRVDGFVPVAHAWELRVGQPVAFRAEIPQLDLPIERTSFPGKITFVDPRVQELTQSIRVSAEVQNPRLELREGLSGTMRIELPTVEAPRTSGAGTSASTGPRPPF